MTTLPVVSSSVLQELPPEWGEELLASIARDVRGSKDKIVILDDDPTGTQTARDLPVLTHWSVEALEEELAGEYPAFFILTNSRSLPQGQACDLARQLGNNLAEASRKTGVRVIIISRSDSTLRGHFPAEVDAMAEVMGKTELPYLILPFFLEGGRYTIGDIHYVQEGDSLIPAAQTPFARDAVFGFDHSNLCEWLEEKSGSRIRAKEVVSITIEDIRLGGPKRVAEILAGVEPAGACIVNCVSYRDMEVFVAALLQVEKDGHGFLYRTAASFVRIRTGLGHKNVPLSREELTSSSPCGGLFVIGSYVEKSSHQLGALLKETDITPVEIRVEQLLEPQSREKEVARVAAKTNAALGRGRDCAVYTSRELVTGSDAVSNLQIGQTVSDSLIDIVKSLEVQPRYLVAKGGITSSDVATKGLGVRRAMVIGQPLPGVPAWKLGAETRYPGMTYIVFPGNVGDNRALVEIKDRLRLGGK